MSFLEFEHVDVSISFTLVCEPMVIFPVFEPFAFPILE